MLKVNSIKKSFKGNEVLKGIDLTVDAGEIIHIKGSNGCGKSTLLKIIADLLLPDEGSIELSNNVKIGALIENPNFIESESLAFNLEFLYSLTNEYDNEAKNKIKELVQKFSLNFDQKSNLKKYSLGMRQKVGIIQAIMENQNLILFDEPTRGLDQESILVFNQLIEDLIKEEKSIIICAHDGIEQINFTHRYELKDGKIKKIA